MTNPTTDLEPAWNDLTSRLRAFVAKRVEPDVAEDLTQDVLARSIAAGAPESVDDLRAWLYRAARNAVIDHYRTRRVHGEVPDLVADDWPVELAAARERAELAACATAMIDAIDEPYREAVRMVDVEGVSQVDAAERFGLSVPGMKSRVQRGRRKVRALVEQCCTVEFDEEGGVDLTCR